MSPVLDEPLVRGSGDAFDVEGFRTDEPFAIDTVVVEIIDIDDRVDPDAHFCQCLLGRREVQQQDLFLSFAPWLGEAAGRISRYASVLAPHHPREAQHGRWAGRRDRTVISASYIS